MNIINIIKENMDKMTKSEYNVALYCLGNLNDFAFDTLDSVAGKIGTSTSSVLRFCRRLGFDGFKPFQESIRETFRYQPSLPDKFSKAVKKGTSGNLVDKTLSNSIACLEKTFGEMPYERLYDAANRINEAKRVFTFGMRESFALAHYAYTRFVSVRENVQLLSAGNCAEVEALIGISREDVCIVYLFHRYTKQALDVITALKRQGACIILVTSPPFEVASENATVLLPCYVDVDGIKNSSVAAVCLTDYLCNAVALAGGNAALAHMKAAEKLFSDFSVLCD